MKFDEENSRKLLNTHDALREFRENKLREQSRIVSKMYGGAISSKVILMGYETEIARCPDGILAKSGDMTQFPEEVIYRLLLDGDISKPPTLKLTKLDAENKIKNNPYKITLDSIKNAVSSIFHINNPK